MRRQRPALAMQRRQTAVPLTPPRANRESDWLTRGFAARTSAARNATGAAPGGTPPADHRVSILAPRVRRLAARFHLAARRPTRAGRYEAASARCAEPRSARLNRRAHCAAPGAAALRCDIGPPASAATEQ